jgi:hypothetical protein
MLTSDAAALAMQQCGAALKQLSKVPSQASREASSEILKRIDRQFDEQKDPYGKPWRPLKQATLKRKGFSLIGFETGRLRGGLRVAPTSGAGIGFEFDAPYAKYFQAKRPILPTRGVPRAWAAIVAVALEHASQRWARDELPKPVAELTAHQAMVELSYLLSAAE